MTTLPFTAEGSVTPVPVATPKPVGRVEWTDYHGRLYGVDAVGNVWLFKGGVPAARRSAASRLAAAILGWLR